MLTQNWREEFEKKFGVDILGGKVDQSDFESFFTSKLKEIREEIRGREAGEIAEQILTRWIGNNHER